MRTFLTLCALCALASSAQGQPFSNTGGDETVNFAVSVTEWCWLDASPNAGSYTAMPDGNTNYLLNITGSNLRAGTNNDTGGCDVRLSVSHLHLNPAPQSLDLDEITFAVTVAAPGSVYSGASNASLGTSTSQTWIEGESGAQKEVASDMLQSIADRAITYGITFGSTAAAGSHIFTAAYQAVATP